eukprot:270406_1
MISMLRRCPLPSQYEYVISNRCFFNDFCLLCHSNSNSFLSFSSNKSLSGSGRNEVFTFGFLWIIFRLFVLCISSLFSSVSSNFRFFVLIGFTTTSSSSSSSSSPNDKQLICKSFFIIFFEVRCLCNF